jgi:hypothetical protein
MSCSHKDGSKFNIAVIDTLSIPKNSNNNKNSIQDSIYYSNPPKVNITKNQRVSSPLVIEMQSNENWKAYSKSLGVVSLLNAEDFDIEYDAAALIASEENWKSKGIHFYTATLKFDSTKFENGVLFFEYHPQNGKDFKYLKIPVRTK